MSVLDVIRIRSSIRNFLPDTIPDDVLERLMESIRYAPSAANIQPWRFILTTEPKRRKQVAEACKKQMWMAEAPLIIAGCGFPDQAYKSMGGYANSVEIDIAIALDHLTLAAAEEGLGTCWIGAFDEQAVKEVLGIPKEVRVVTLTPIGYPANKDAFKKPVDKKRKEPAEIFFNERWQ